MAVLYVICGHGKSAKLGYDPGSTGGGYQEADLVRKLAARMKALAPNNVVVLDTNQDWLYGDWDYIKRTVGNNPLVELHMDAAGAGARGGHVIICEGLAPDSYDNKLAANITTMFPGRSSKIVKRDNLGNPKKAKARNINYRLLECCFISDTNDRNKFINQMDAVATTILDAFGISVGKDWFDMATKAELEALLKPINDRLTRIEREVLRTDDPTGRKKEMTTHTHVKWMAKNQSEIMDQLNRIEETVDQIATDEDKNEQ